MQQKHDAGGKVKTKLAEHIIGEAILSPCERYRPILTRDWSNGDKPRKILWIGMNPSTALQNINDPTVTREQNFSSSWGYNKYVKCNVMDYRSTDQKKLTDKTIQVCSKVNLATIIYAAKKADMIVLAHGTLKPEIAPYGDIVSITLHALNLKVHALKISQNGSPYHPLYLAADTKPIAFQPRALSQKQIEIMKRVYPISKLIKNLNENYVPKEDAELILEKINSIYNDIQ